MLDDVAAANPGIRSAVLDVDDAETFPKLNMLVNDAGIWRSRNLRVQPDHLAAAEAMITTNLVGQIRLTVTLTRAPRRSRHSSLR